MSRRLWSLIVLPLFASIGLAQEAKKDAPRKDDVKHDTRILVRCERTDPVFALDEPASFLFATNTSGELAYRFKDDGHEVIKEGKLRVAAGRTYKLEQKAEKPCILHLELEQSGAKTLAVAAVAPTKIEPSTPAPADFSEFWRKQRQALADAKIDSDLDFVAPYSNQLLTTSRLSLGSVDGKHVQAWITMPKGPGPYPVVIDMPQWGVFPLQPDLDLANLGCITIKLSIHDLPLDAPGHVYKAASDKELKNYWMKGFDDKSKTYLRYGILAGVRAIDYVAARKDFNGQIAVTGSRQGGGLAVMLAGLDSRVTHLAADLPAFCDMDAKAHEHRESWPHWLTIAPENLKAKVRETAGYYDACNFASDFKGKSLFRVGYMDEVCPARSVYAAYNRLPGPKEIIATPPVAPNDPRWSAQWATKRTEFLTSNLTMQVPTGKLPVAPPAPPAKKR